MAHKNDGFPALVVSNFEGFILNEYRSKLQKKRIDPHFTTFSRLPDVLTVKDLYGVLVVLTDQSVESQRDRVKKLSKASGLPMLTLTRQFTRAESLFAQLLPNKNNPKEVLQFLVSGVEDQDRPWGWVHAYKKAGFINFPDSVASVPDFLAYVFRLPPENLPESLRSRTVVATPAISSTQALLEEKEIVSTLPPKKDELPALAPPFSVENSEEYLLLKEEYDQAVLKLQDVTIRLRDKDEHNQALLQQISEMQAELNRLQEELKGCVSSEAIKSLAEQWKKEGQKIANEPFIQKIQSLTEQVAELQEELDRSDKTITRVMSELESASKECEILKEAHRQAKARLQLLDLKLTKRQRDAISLILDEDLLTKALSAILRSAL